MATGPPRTISQRFGNAEEWRPHQVPRADVLLVATTDIEIRALEDAYREATGRVGTWRPVGDRTYLDFGDVEGARIWVALTEQGSGGLGGSQMSVGKAIDALMPRWVVLVGVAFGVDDTKQVLGDILVARQLLLYELQRVGTSKDGQYEIIPRGDRPHASAALIERMRAAALSWTDSRPEVRVGLMLSGDKLVDN